ncbi:MAG: T9SS type A sorting domain-containing protein [Bacteroidales bacterium]|jgi:hypothetical protein
MKKIFIVCLIVTINLLISINAFSQTYKSIYGKNFTEWNISVEICDGFATYSFTVCPDTICSDTIINTRKYKKIVFADGGNICLASYYNKCLFINEDTLNGKLWLYDSYEEKEYLSMDLNLNVGDTFKMNPNTFTDSIAIVDSVYYENSCKKIRFNYVDWPEQKLTFIEGIGPTFGVFFQASGYSCSEPPRLLLCVSKDGKYVYKNKLQEATDTCFYFSVNVIEKSKNNIIEIKPNPVQKELNFTFHSLFDGSIIIYNMLGIIESKINLKDITTYKTDMTSFKSGIYFVRILNNNLSVTKKIIKN